MVMHSAFPGLIAAADRLPSCPDCGYYLTANAIGEGYHCSRCVKPHTGGQTKGPDGFMWDRVTLDCQCPTCADVRADCTPEELAELRTNAQHAALAEYIAAREEWEGLRDDIAFSNSFAEKDEAAAQLPAAQSRYGAARKEAERLGVLAVGRRMFC